jgi:hypothetical protein
VQHVLDHRLLQNISRSKLRACISPCLDEKIQATELVYIRLKHTSRIGLDRDFSALRTPPSAPPSFIPSCHKVIQSSKPPNPNPQPSSYQIAASSNHQPIQSPCLALCACRLHLSQIPLRARPHHHAKQGKEKNVAQPARDQHVVEPCVCMCQTPLLAVQTRRQRLCLFQHLGHHLCRALADGIYGTIDRQPWGGGGRGCVALIPAFLSSSLLPKRPAAGAPTGRVTLYVNS